MLNHFLPRALQTSPLPADLGLTAGEYVLLTVHRPLNADDPAALDEILRGAAAIGRPVVFPVHPRTRRHLAGAAQPFAPGAEPAPVPATVRLIEPVGYLDMLALTARAAVVLTDSGGLQKEAAFLGVPCVTLRGVTEWTETLDLGLNRLTGDRPAAERIAAEAGQVIELRAGWAVRQLDDYRSRRIERYFGPADVSRIIAQTLVDYLETA